MSGEPNPYVIFHSCNETCVYIMRYDMEPRPGFSERVLLSHPSSDIGVEGEG